MGVEALLLLFLGHGFHFSGHVWLLYSSNGIENAYMFLEGTLKINKINLISTIGTADFRCKDIKLVGCVLMNDDQQERKSRLLK